LLWRSGGGVARVQFAPRTIWRSCSPPEPAACAEAEFLDFARFPPLMIHKACPPPPGTISGHQTTVGAGQCLALHPLHLPPARPSPRRPSPRAAEALPARCAPRCSPCCCWCSAAPGARASPRACACVLTSKHFPPLHRTPRARARARARALLPMGAAQGRRPNLHQDLPLLRLRQTGGREPIHNLTLGEYPVPSRDVPPARCASTGEPHAAAPPLHTPNWPLHITPTHQPLPSGPPISPSHQALPSALPPIGPPSHLPSLPSGRGARNWGGVLHGASHNAHGEQHALQHRGRAQEARGQVE
jgi:hypothetical protein